MGSCSRKSSASSPNPVRDSCCSAWRARVASKRGTSKPRLECVSRGMARAPSARPSRRPASTMRTRFSIRRKAMVFSRTCLAAEPAMRPSACVRSGVRRPGSASKEAPRSRSRCRFTPHSARSRSRRLLSAPRPAMARFRSKSPATSVASSGRCNSSSNAWASS